MAEKPLPPDMPPALDAEDVANVLTFLSSQGPDLDTELDPDVAEQAEIGRSIVLQQLAQHLRYAHFTTREENREVLKARQEEASHG